MPLVDGEGDAAVAAGGIAVARSVALAGDDVAAAGDDAAGDCAGNGGGNVSGPFWPQAPSALAAIAIARRAPRIARRPSSRWGEAGDIGAILPAPERRDPALSA